MSEQNKIKTKKNQHNFYANEWRMAFMLLEVAVMTGQFEPILFCSARVFLPSRCCSYSFRLLVVHLRAEDDLRVQATIWCACFARRNQSRYNLCASAGTCILRDDDDSVLGRWRALSRRRRQTNEGGENWCDLNFECARHCWPNWRGNHLMSDTINAHEKCTYEQFRPTIICIQWRPHWSASIIFMPVRFNSIQVERKHINYPHEMKLLISFCRWIGRSCARSERFNAHLVAHFCSIKK